MGISRLTINIHFNKNMFKSFSIFLIIFAISLSLLYCTKKEYNFPIEELTFDVDSLLLEKAYFDSILGISFHPPINWKIVSDEIFAQIENIQKEMNYDTVGFKVIPSQIFVDSIDNTYCFLSQLITNDTINSDEVINRFKKILEEKYSKTDIKEGTFRLKNFFIDQFIISENDIVLLKLIISSQSNSPFLIDYIIPLKVYEKNLKAAESSIGSIKKLK